MHFLRRHPVNFSLRARDARKNPNRSLLHPRRKFALRNQLTNFRKIAPMFMIMVVIVMVMMLMLIVAVMVIMAMRMLVMMMLVRVFVTVAVVVFVMMIFLKMHIELHTFDGGLGRAARVQVVAFDAKLFEFVLEL